MCGYDLQAGLCRHSQHAANCRFAGLGRCEDQHGVTEHKCSKRRAITRPQPPSRPWRAGRSCLASTSRSSRHLASASCGMCRSSTPRGATVDTTCLRPPTGRIRRARSTATLFRSTPPCPSNFRTRAGRCRLCDTATTDESWRTGPARRGRPRRAHRRRRGDNAVISPDTLPQPAGSQACVAHAHRTNVSP